jgi:hypothetical protein
LMTVVLEIPSRCAIRAFGTPSAASLLISAQSSKVITLQSLSAHLFTGWFPATIATRAIRKGDLVCRLVAFPRGPVVVR